MAITMEQIAENSTDKLVAGFINEIITDSYLLSAMPFDDCLTSNGISNFSYRYKRIKTPAQAAFREINKEPAVTEIKTESITTSPGILSAAWTMDRVAKEAANDFYEAQLDECKNAIIRKFNETVISGDTDTDAAGFDGLDKALTGSDTEDTSAVDLDKLATDKDVALAFANEMDNFLAKLTRTPDALLVSQSMAARINGCLRVLGLASVTMNDAGQRVSTWDGIRVEPLRDGALTTDDVYAVCFGLNEFHGITLSGGNAVRVALPDWNAPTAVKTGDCEFVCGCALKATKAAGVLRAKANG